MPQPMPHVAEVTVGQRPLKRIGWRNFDINSLPRLQRVAEVTVGERPLKPAEADYQLHRKIAAVAEVPAGQRPLELHAMRVAKSVPIREPRYDSL